MQKEIETKIARILYLLNSMDKGSVNLKTQAEELRVAPRTLQRYIKVLIAAGFPICDSRPGVYTFMKGASLERMKLSAEEAALLCVMGDISRSLGGNFGKTFLQLKGRFMSAAESPFLIKIGNIANLMAPEIVLELETAIRDKVFVNIFYSGDKPRYCNNLKPLKIFWAEGFWYLIALPEKENFYFKFRMDKITRVLASQKKFSCSGDVDQLLADSKNIWFGNKRDKKIMLKISGHAVSYFKKQEYFPYQKIEKENKDGSLIVSSLVSNFMEVLPQIKRWIPDVRVLGPQTLAKELAAQLEEYLKNR